MVNLWSDHFRLTIEYDHIDIWVRYARFIRDVNDPKLYAGIAHPDGWLYQKGKNGYKLMLRKGGVRFFITDRVNDQLKGTKHEGQGMGITVEFSPQWLHQYAEPFSPNTLRKHVYRVLQDFGIEHPETYRIRISRLDITIDVRGFSVSDLPFHDFNRRWVGSARPRQYHLSRKTGELTGISVGSREGNTSFIIYDKVAESEHDGDARYWRSVWGVDEDEDLTVTRFEWSFRPYRAKFPNLQYLADYTFEGFLGLLNYATLIWGRLCIPQEDENHKTRWELDPLWAELRAFIDDWSFNYERVVRPQYDVRPDIKDSYLNALTGWLAGLQARLGIEKDKDGPVSLAQALAYLHREGYTMEDILDRAGDKWDIFSRLLEEAPDA